MIEGQKMVASVESLHLIIEWSPDALLILSLSGTVLYANLAAEKLFEQSVSEMLGTEFGFPIGGEKSIEIEVLSKSGVMKVAEMRLVEIAWEGEAAHLLSLRDMTARKKNEDQQRLGHQILTLLNRPSSIKETVHEALSLIKKNTTFNAVAIRFWDGNDYPYYASAGFSEGFQLSEPFMNGCATAGTYECDGSEDTLSECMCGTVLRGRTNQNLPHYTEEGSFWTNSITKFLATTSEADRQACTFDYCLGKGYESVALIPLRFGEVIIGLMQINDHRPDQFTPEILRFYEGLGSSIGVALSRERLQEKLYEEQVFTEKALDSLMDIFFVIDLEGRFLRWNKALNNVTGYLDSEITLMNPLEMIGESDRQRVAEAILTAVKDGAVTVEAQLVARDGMQRPYHFKANLMRNAQNNPTGFSGVGRDLGHLKELEGHLRHVQKMEAVGTLAGGVAHDFNNLLNVIIGYGDIILNKLAADSSSREDMQLVLQAADKAAILTKKLLTFSRKEPVNIKLFSLNELIVDVRKMLDRMISESLQLHLDLTEIPLLVQGDAGMIEQVLMNLVTNARDSMMDEGELTISTELKIFEDDFETVDGYGKIGEYAMITVADSGSGIDVETQKRIFEPFFTTKEMGRGTGLGLAISYEIIKKHHGYVRVQSELGLGTKFDVFLPLSKETAPSGERTTDSRIKVEGDNETILVADDDPGILTLIRITLESFGYLVITARDGEEALAEFVKNQQRIDFVLLDTIMPKSGGKELAVEIRAINPGIKILIMSGYPEGMGVSEGLQPTDFDFIDKPFQSHDLLLKVREVLDK